jgi:hypothetical protein
MALKEKKFYPIFKAKAWKGNLVFEKKDDLRQYLYGIDEKRVDVVIKKEVKHRSRQEEKYYHGVIVGMVAEAMSIENQQAHEFLKSLFLRVEEKTPSGFRMERILSTVELSDASYREYWGKCQRWASLPTLDEGLGLDSGLSLFIPSPNEVDYSNY